MTKIYWTLFLALPFLGTRRNQAGACSCIQIPSIRESFDSSDSIFTGTLVSYDDVADPPYAVFGMLEMYKGIAEKDERVVFSNTTTCGLTLFFKPEAIGRQFIVYATKTENGDAEYVSACSRTKRMKESLMWETNRVFKAATEYDFPECYLPEPKTGEECEQLIRWDRPDLTVQFVPKDNPVTTDIRADRVRIYVDTPNDGDVLEAPVAKVPQVG